MKSAPPFTGCSASVGCCALFALFLGLIVGNAYCQEAVSAEHLVGTWKVDLRPTPESDPYFKEFVVTAVEGNTFTGTFYDTEISEARINTDWGKLRIAFVTEDGSGAYHHSATLEKEGLEGQSNSTGRGFLSYWSAVKQ